METFVIASVSHSIGFIYFEEEMSKLSFPVDVHHARVPCDHPYGDIGPW
jgi:hypothetical protein